ncbi:hypothetical protein TIFTF001_049127 [Ficus carica]|uniref:Uncharacterized protein n=1 Tax=Ficus carica TaxID=3494 RepID=A0AA87ZDL4_FICCA|nr:hypothetical protein TIFTF001_049127 [Ficus carica]
MNLEPFNTPTASSSSSPFFPNPSGQITLLIIHSLTLQRPMGILSAINGNFSGGKTQEIVVARGKVLDLRQEIVSLFGVEESSTDEDNRVKMRRRGRMTAEK